MRSRRPTRLKDFEYVGRFGYSLRFATLHRVHHFTNAALVAGALVQIQRTCDEEGFALIAYCFMPDHIHLAIRGTAAESNLRRFVKIAKQRVAYVARTQFAIPSIWQDGYYERVVRSHGMESLVRYILNNPVRAGLVEHAQPVEYPARFGAEILGARLRPREGRPLDQEHAEAGLREQGGGGAAGRTGADDHHVPVRRHPVGPIRRPAAPRSQPRRPFRAR